MHAFWNYNPVTRQSLVRDLRFDVIRGLALIWIFIDHIEGNRLQALTLQRFSFIDAAEVFIVISGYVCGLVYTRTFDRHGPLSTVKKAAVRCFQLYLAQIAIFAVSCLILHQFAVRGTYLSHGSTLETYMFMEHPVEAVLAMLAMVHAPGLLGLLTLYIVLLAYTPIAIFMFTRSPMVGIAVSIALYLIAQLAPGITLYLVYPDQSRWFFNPLAWQLVYVIGLFLGMCTVRGKALVKTPPRWFTAFAVGGLSVVAFLSIARTPTLSRVLVDWNLGQFAKLLESIPYPFPFTEKGIVQPLRMLNLFLWIVVIARWSRDNAYSLRKPLAPLILLGSNSLVVYSVGVVLSYTVTLTSAHWNTSQATMTGLSLVGIVFMIIAAKISNGWAASTRTMHRPSTG